MQVRIERLPARTVAVVAGIPREADVDSIRRPMYQHMILHELIGGPSVLRFHDAARHPEGPLDALVVTHTGFDGDDVCAVETLPAGSHAVADYEGPAAGLPDARRAFAAASAALGARGPVLQVHLMDEVDGVTEQQFQRPVG